ncbi:MULTISPECIES: hypothetical protein [unclassified Fibrobacter]|uniref:hypothetical protein n=1 Tax=unclassified Fibrobacter TaxID=2634177 RepID=UPI000D6AB9FB|nr:MULTISPECIES: hypothetical protein [unclassified Fibrobacter]PWJ63062.1 hypothetical protein BGX12_11963 [Fibrobacter sp. UWR4]PZW68233.1 hypothetical protein C8E88_101963 [Fibrobacter sp. UWR1]
MTQKVVSFDVFDTSLIRKCGIPEIIWDLMLDYLFDQNDISSRTTFKVQRKYAESIARECKPFPNIRDIYNAMDLSQWQLKKDNLIQLEKTIEQKQLIAPPDIKNTIFKYRKQGYKVIFISDTYLSSSFIKSVLEREKVFQNDDEIFVSNEYQALKEDGTLFHLIKEKKNFSFNKWTHFGDNEKADYLAPQKLGISAIWYKKNCYSHHEKNWLKDSHYYTGKTDIELFTGLSRCIRILNGNSPDVALAANAISSAYIPYVYKILQEAQKRGIKSLYFLARDSHIFLEIANLFSTLFPQISLHYLKVSRRSVYPCYFYEASVEELKWILSKAKGHKITAALSHMGLSWKDLFTNQVPPFNKEDFLDSKTISLVASFLSSTCADKIKQCSQIKRDNFLGYLTQEGIFLDGPKGIVDLGWEGSTRICINRILSKEGMQPIFSFYWGYSKQVKQDHQHDGVFFFNSQSETTIPRSAYILEHYFSANQEGTTIGYEKINDFYYAILGSSNKRTAITQETNETIVCQISSLLVHIISQREMHLQDIFNCCGKKTLNKISTEPSYNEAKIFAKIQAENFNQEKPLVENFSLKDIITMSIWGHPTRDIWQEAAFTIAFNTKAAFFKKIFRITSNSYTAFVIRVFCKKLKLLATFFLKILK